MTNEYDQMEEYFNFLDSLRESGITNMFGAAPYLKKAYSLRLEYAKRVVGLWMKTFPGRGESASMEKRVSDALKMKGETA